MLRLRIQTVSLRHCRKLKHLRPWKGQPVDPVVAMPSLSKTQLVLEPVPVPISLLKVPALAADLSSMRRDY